MLGLAVALGLRDVGDDSPEQAIYALAHAIEHENADGACSRLLDPDDVPRAARDVLEVTGGTTTRRPCEERFSSPADYDAFGFEEALVDELRTVEVPDGGGVSAAAVADVRLDGTRRERVVLVHHEGRWKVVR